MFLNKNLKFKELKIMETQVVAKPQVVTREALASELNLGKNDLYSNPADNKVVDIDPEIVASVQPEVDKFFQNLMDKNKDAAEKTATIYTLGRKAETTKNEFLDRQMKELMTGEGNGQLANGLLNLRDQIAKLDPNLYFGDKSIGGFGSRLARRLAGDNEFFKKLVRKYLDQYTSSETVIQEIVLGLQEGGKKLQRNNITLGGEKTQMRSDVEQLKKAIAFGQLLDEKIEKAIAEATDAEWKQILSEEILFPLRQRINSLRKTRVAKANGILTYEMIVRTNQQLINGILNADQVIEILKIAITEKLAIQDAKKVNEAIAALDKLAGDLLVETSEDLHKVVLEVYKVAAQAGIPIQQLIIAHQNVLATIKDYSKYIQDQLPIMKEEATHVEELNKEVEEANKRMERGSRIGLQISESMKDLF